MQRQETKDEVEEAALGLRCWLGVGGGGGRTTPARFSGSSGGGGTGVKWNAGSLMRHAAAADLDGWLAVCLARMQKTVKRKRKGGGTLEPARQVGLKFVYTDGVQCRRASTLRGEIMRLLLGVARWTAEAPIRSQIVTWKEGGLVNHAEPHLQVRLAPSTLPPAI